jgi:hypothetical protein
MGADTAEGSPLDGTRCTTAVRGSDRPCFDVPVGTASRDVLELMSQLEDVDRTDGSRYATFRVHGHTFGYLWDRTQTVGLKQLLSEQLALVAERPDVFEVQFTMGQFGWVVVHLDAVDRAELAELVFEAWRLTAPVSIVDARGDRLPH